jgi:hypothetical protein
VADNSNMKIWEALGKTAPQHTKSFKRAGGFGGTAIKPIYTTQKMTEVFGPAGMGWGMGEPSFQVVPGHNGEVLVYCTVRLWWVLPGGSEVNEVYGVGGDKVVSHIKANEQYNRPERWENDDEAFKKAFTDAVGNAMKHLGMSADVHMGLFDDSKYVREREEEERPKQPSGSSEPRVAPTSSPLLQDRVEKGQALTGGPANAGGEGTAETYARLQVALADLPADLVKLRAWSNNPKVKEAIASLPDKEALNINDAITARIEDTKELTK